MSDLDGSRRGLWLPLLGLLVSGMLAALPMLWMDSVGWSLAANSLMLVLAVIAIAVPLGTLLAIVLFRFAVPLRRLWVFLLALQVFVPLYVYGAAWRSTLGFTGWAHDTPLGKLSWLTLEGWPGAIWVHAAAAIPWVVLIVGLALRYVEPELEEDALTSGSFAQVLGRVTLRRAAAAALVAALWISVIVATEITATDLFQVRTFAEELYSSLAATNTTPVNQTQAAIANTTIAAWLALVLMVVVSRIAAFTKDPPSRQAVLFPLTAGKRWLLGLGTAVFLLVLVGVPLGTLVRNAGITFVVGPDGVPYESWTASKTVNMVADGLVLNASEFSWSLQTAVAAATLVLLLAAPVCWFARQGGWRGFPAMSLAAVGLALPGPLIAFGLVQFFNQRDSEVLVFLYDRTIVPPMLAQMIKGLPLSILILSLLLRGVPEETLESASTEGAGGWTRWWRIAMPQRIAALAVAWLAAFAIALGEVPASIIVKAPGIEFVSTRIFQLLHGENVYEIAGIILAMLGIFALAGGVIAVVCQIYWRRD